MRGGGAFISSMRWPPGAIARARGSPQCSRRRLDLEAVLLEAGEGGIDLGADDGDVGAGRDHRVVLVHEVDLGAGALDPGEAAVEGVGDDG